MILVGTDRSEAAQAAVAIALELARARDEDILFVTAWKELRGDFGLPYDRLFSPSSAEIERDWASKTAAAAVEQAGEAGVHAEAEVRHGRAAHELCAVARERNARLIVVGSSGWGPVEGALIGSVSQGVLRRAPCPVLVVHARPEAATSGPP